VTHSFHRAIVLSAACLTLSAGAVGAQSAPASTRSLVPATFPRWDAGGSIGLLTLTTTESRRSWSDWDGSAEYRFDIGHYWTTHLKTDVAVTTSHTWSDWRSELLSIPGVPSAYAYTQIDRRLFGVAPAVTWQFRDNSFMHPYVSGGVKLSFLEEHSYRDAATQRSGPISYQVPGLDERRTIVLARPFVAGGFKSYINRSVFVRTEGRVAFAQDGVRQVSALVGAGFDF
jgi:hypothetical protein